MHRAARSVTADHVRVLLQQLLFVHRVKLLAMRLQYQLEETMDDLDARCDRTMLMTEQRILRVLLR